MARMPSRNRSSGEMKLARRSRPTERCASCAGLRLSAARRVSGTSAEHHDAPMSPEAERGSSASRPRHNEIKPSCRLVSPTASSAIVNKQFLSSSGNRRARRRRLLAQSLDNPNAFLIVAEVAETRLNRQSARRVCGVLAAKSSARPRERNAAAGMLGPSIRGAAAAMPTLPSGRVFALRRETTALLGWPGLTRRQWRKRNIMKSRASSSRPAENACRLW